MTHADPRIRQTILDAINRHTRERGVDVVDFAAPTLSGFVMEFDAVFADGSRLRLTMDLFEAFGPSALNLLITGERGGGAPRGADRPR